MIMVHWWVEFTCNMCWFNAKKHKFCRWHLSFWPNTCCIYWITQNAVPWNNLTMKMIDIGNTHQTWFWICFGIIAKYPDTVLECVWMYYIWTGTWYIMQCTKKCTHHSLWYNDGNQIPGSIRHKFLTMFACGGTHLFLSGFWMMNTPSTKGNGRPVGFFSRCVMLQPWTCFQCLPQCQDDEDGHHPAPYNRLGHCCVPAGKLPMSKCCWRNLDGIWSLQPSSVWRFFFSREGNNPTFAGRSLMAGGSLIHLVISSHASCQCCPRQETGGGSRCHRPGRERSDDKLWTWNLAMWGNYIMLGFDLTKYGTVVILVWMICRTFGCEHQDFSVP